MDLSKENMDALLGFLKQTKDREATCDDCLAAMAEFAETHLAGKTIPESLKAIEDHLEICAGTVRWLAVFLLRIYLRSVSVRPAGATSVSAADEYGTGQ